MFLGLSSEMGSICIPEGGLRQERAAGGDRLTLDGVRGWGVEGGTPPLHVCIVNSKSHSAGATAHLHLPVRL